jgi:hypothetical protein
MQSRQALINSAVSVIAKRINSGKPYKRELNVIRQIEKRRGLTGVVEEIVALAKNVCAGELQ